MAVYIPFPAQVQVIFAEVSVGPALKIWIQIQYITSMALACTAFLRQAGADDLPEIRDSGSETRRQGAEPGRHC